MKTRFCSALSYDASGELWM